MIFAVRTCLVSVGHFLSYFLALSSQACSSTGSLLIHGKFSMPNERRHWTRMTNKLVKGQTNSGNPSLPPQQPDLRFPNISDRTVELAPEDKQPWVKLVSLLRPFLCATSSSFHKYSISSILLPYQHSGYCSTAPGTRASALCLLEG